VNRPENPWIGFQINDSAFRARVPVIANLLTVGLQNSGRKVMRVAVNGIPDALALLEALLTLFAT